MGIADAILDLVSSGTTLRENNLKEIEGGVVLESQVNLTSFWSHVLEKCYLMRVFRHLVLHSAFICSHRTPNIVLQAVLVASRKSLIQRKGVLDTTHEILERLEAHLRAVDQFTVRIFFFCYEHFILQAVSFSHLSWQVTANMRGSSAEEVAERVLTQPSLSGLQVRFRTLATAFYVSRSRNLKSSYQKEKLKEKKKNHNFRLQYHIKRSQFTLCLVFLNFKGSLNAFMVICAGTNCKSSLLQTRWESGGRLLCYSHMCSQKGTLQVSSAAESGKTLLFYSSFYHCYSISYCNAIK